MIKNTTDKIALIIDECLTNYHMDEIEVEFVATKYLNHSAGYYPTFNFIDYIGEYTVEDRTDSINYFDYLSSDLTDKFNDCYDVFISFNIIYDVLNLVYSKEDLNLFDLDSLSNLFEVTDKLNWSMVNNFDKVTDILKTALHQYICSLIDEDTTKLNNILSNYWMYQTNEVHTIILSMDNKFLVNTADNFKTFDLMDVEDLTAYLSDMVNSMEYEDIQLFIEYCIK